MNILYSIRTICIMSWLPHFKQIETLSIANMALK